MTRVRVATYNVHSGVGVDRRFRPERIAGVIDELGADIVALQEVLSPVGGFDVHGQLREASGLHLVTMATMQLAGGTFGNALLSRWPILDLGEHGLTVGNREPRGAIDATIGRDARHEHVEQALAHERLHRRAQIDRPGKPSRDEHPRIQEGRDAESALHVRVALGPRPEERAVAGVFQRRGDLRIRHRDRAAGDEDASSSPRSNHSLPSWRVNAQSHSCTLACTGCVRGVEAPIT